MKECLSLGELIDWLNTLAKSEELSVPTNILDINLRDKLVAPGTARTTICLSSTEETRYREQLEEMGLEIE